MTQDSQHAHEHARQLDGDRSESGRVALVTGAGSGIGRATAELYVARGARVVAVDLDEHALADLAGHHAGITPLVLDVSDPAAVAEQVAEAGRAAGRLDVVVSCAASFVARGVDVAPEDWQQAFGVNVFGLAGVVQAALPMLTGAPGAAVVNVASISAHIAQPQRWTYNATKSAIVGLTRCMAMDLAPHGIRVNSVSPGWIWTPEVARAAEGDRATWEPVWGAYHLLGRLGEASEVAEAIVFLASPRAGFVTGADLPVDGGYLAMGPEGSGAGSRFAGAAR